MTIKNKKMLMLKFRDYYNGDLISLEDVTKAKTNKDLERCLKRHYRFLEDQQTDALTHMDSFIKLLGLY